MNEFENAKRRAKYAADTEYREKAKRQSTVYKDTNRDKVRRYYHEYDTTRRNRKSDEAVSHG